MEKLAFFLSMIPVLCGTASAGESVEALAGKVGKLLTGIPGVQIMPFGDAIVLSGEIDSPAHMSRILAVVDGLESVTLHNLTSLTAEGKRALAWQIETEIGAPDIHVQVLNNYLILQGTAQSDFEADRAVEITKSFIQGSARRIERMPTEEVRRPAAEAKAGNDTGFGGKPPMDTMPLLYNRNGLPTTVVDILRVAPRPPVGKPPGKK